MVITVVARPRRPPSLDWSRISSDQVEITMVVAHRVAERNGSTIHTEKKIRASTNSTSRMLRGRSSDENGPFGKLHLSR
jgi:hypothetical protein